MKIIWLYLEHKVCVAGRIALDHVLKFTFCQLNTSRSNVKDFPAM